MFLLRTVESVDIKNDCFNKSLNPLLSAHRTVKSLRDLQLREEIYDKKLVSRLERESKLLYNDVKSNLNQIDFHHMF